MQLSRSSDQVIKLARILQRDAIEFKKCFGGEHFYKHQKTPSCRRSGRLAMGIDFLSNRARVRMLRESSLGDWPKAYRRVIVYDLFAAKVFARQKKLVHANISIVIS
jgi:hypothetical protein